MTYKQNSMINTRTQPQTLGLHKHSHNITKTQPKIRIIHIYAPEIINTDVANFRELVQSLTGMPQPGETRGQRGKGKPKKINRNSLYESDNLTNKVSHNIGYDKSMVNTKLEVMMGPTTSTTTGSSSSPSSSFDDHNYRNDNQNENQEFWRMMTSMDHNNNNSSGGYLTGVPEFDDNLDLSMFNNILAPVDGSSHYFNSLDKY